MPCISKRNLLKIAGIFCTVSSYKVAKPLITFHHIFRIKHKRSETEPLHSLYVLAFSALCYSDGERCKKTL